MNPNIAAKGALARGDSQYIFLHEPDSSVMFIKMQEPGGFELRYADIRNVQASDLGMSLAYLRVHGDSILKFLDRYNRRMLLAHAYDALCDASSKETFCLKAAR